MFNTLKKGFTFVCVLWVVTLTGCGSFLPTPEPVNIKFPHMESDTAYYELLAQQFHEENPYITVELVKMARPSFSQIVQNDVFVMEQLSLPELLKQNLILNVTPFIEQDEGFNPSDFYAGTLAAFNYEGKTWGVPSELNMIVMYYNKDLFDRYGVPYPQPGWTWDDFLNAAIDTTDPSADVFGYAIQHANEMSVMEPIIFIYQHGGQLFDSWQNPTVLTFNDPRNIEAMQWYADLILGYGVAPTRQQGPDSVRYYPAGGVLEGKYAMWMGLLSEQGGKTWGREWPMRWGVVPLPRDQNATTLAIINGIFVSSKTEHPDECWKWASFLSQQMPTLNMSARQSLAGSSEYALKVGSDVAEAARTAAAEAILINPNLLGYEQALTTLLEAFAQIRDGTLTPDAALDAAQKEADF